jgi:nucleoside-diphosphate-sugar epimerase
MITIAITGASGYIGKHLVAELARQGGCRIKVLSRSRRQEIDAVESGCNIEVMEGDLRAPETLRGFFEPGCTVVNLVYLRNAGQAENIAVIDNLLAACRSAKIGRLIHCSTADVAGRTRDNPVTESTPCHPVTEYGITKLKVEKVVLDAAGSLEAAILRPTAVFGRGGENLNKLAGNLVAGRRVRNYLKSCLFGKRRMNLVHIANVVAAILFLIHHAADIGGEVFIASDDDNPTNNYADVERFLMREFNIPYYSMPRFLVPPGVLSFLLRLLGRNNINPRSVYAPGKLIGYGYTRPVSFENGLAEYTAWYRSSFIDRREG